MIYANVNMILIAIENGSLYYEAILEVDPLNPDADKALAGLIAQHGRLIRAKMRQPGL